MKVPGKDEAVMTLEEEPAPELTKNKKLQGRISLRLSAAAVAAYV